MDIGSIDPAVTGDPQRIGRWSFIPQPLAGKALEQDMALLFPKR